MFCLIIIYSYIADIDYFSKSSIWLLPKFEYIDIMQRISLINWKSNQNCDVDYSQWVSAIIKWWIVCQNTKRGDFDYDVGTKTVWSGMAFIPFERNVAPLTTKPNWLANYFNDAPVPVPNNPNSFVWIELDPLKLSDPLSICDIDNTTQYALGQWLGWIKFWPAYPTDRPIIKLYRFDTAGVLIDDRERLRLTDCIEQSILDNLSDDIYIKIKQSLEADPKITLKNLCISDTITILPWAELILPPSSSGAWIGWNQYRNNILWISDSIIWAVTGKEINLNVPWYYHFSFWGRQSQYSGEKIYNIYKKVWSTLTLIKSVNSWWFYRDNGNFWNYYIETDDIQFNAWEDVFIEEQWPWITDNSQIIYWPSPLSSVVWISSIVWSGNGAVAYSPNTITFVPVWLQNINVYPYVPWTQATIASNQITINYAGITNITANLTTYALALQPTILRLKQNGIVIASGSASQWFNWYINVTLTASNITINPWDIFLLENANNQAVSISANLTFTYL